jgi:hypothetical protein
MPRRRLRVYELYETMFGFSARTWDYVRFKGPIVRVAARTIRQAYFLAGHGIWTDGPGSPGIVEVLDERDGPDGRWVCWNGQRGPAIGGRYRHGQSWEKPKGGDRESKNRTHSL